MAAAKTACSRPVQPICFCRLAPSSGISGRSLRGPLYFQTLGVRDFFERVRDKVEFVWPLEAMDYGQIEFGIRDPDRYVLAFAEAAGEK
jgi:hypothetical protein